MDRQAFLLGRVLEAHPDIRVKSARLHTHEGQFNDILIVNEELIFRFPRSPHVAASLVHETAILSRIQPYLTLAIPNPIYGNNVDLAHPDRIFMGYQMIPGEALWNETLQAIGDEGVLQRLADQLATFLRELHNIPVATLGLDLPASDRPDDWSAMYAQFRDSLFPFMRPDAREWVTRQFDTFLGDPRNCEYQPVLRHGDFGTGNILYDPEAQVITGVIDFSSAALGDPAVDIAAMSTSGMSFLRRFYGVYPEIPAMLKRAEFYRSTFALQQALYALRDGDQASFVDGISQYV